MISYDYNIRVPYGDVDRMGFLYHAHYVRYFDMARTELIRSLGITNLELEEQGVMLPVLNVNINYGTPAHYDDLLTIRLRGVARRRHPDHRQRNPRVHEQRYIQGHTTAQSPVGRHRQKHVTRS